MEVALATRDVQAQEDFWVGLFDAKVLFRGRMMGQRYLRLVACGITLIFRENPELVLPPGPGDEIDFLQHLGLRVDDLGAAVAELESRGARFVFTPATAPDYFRRWQQRPGGAAIETTYIAAPLTRERIAAGEYTHAVAILVAPDNLWIELNQVREPADTGWYPSVRA
jgi:catechol 2,3-dioxygenase-like lactoylglutathione lyase family enzyme